MQSRVVTRIGNLLLALLAAISVISQPILAQDGAGASTRRIVAALQPFVDSHSLAGAVTLVADKDQVLGLEAVGYADVATRKPMKTDALFWIASMSKPITVTALMILVDEGKVKLDDAVERYLPEFANVKIIVTSNNGSQVRLQKPRHAITVRNLLSHTSGIPFSSSIEQPTLDVLALATRVKSYALVPLLFEPGTNYSYSNAGINTAARIIEVASGMSYTEFLQKCLFDPLGMKDTTFWPSKEQLTRLPKSYRPTFDKTNLEETTITQLKYPLDDHKRRPMPAGGLFSTAADLARFCQMILNKGVFQGKKVLTESAVSEMTRKQTGDAIKTEYGLGWETAGGVFGHGGAYATNMTIDPNRGLILVYLVQHAGFPGNGGVSKEAFHRAAREQFGSPGKQALRAKSLSSNQHRRPLKSRLTGLQFCQIRPR
jgi:CubicO group peptidase (beta-lactamase class C family)